MGGDSAGRTDRWRARPAAAGLVRVLALGLPLLAGLAVGRAAATTLADADLPGATGLGVVAGVAVAVGARRLLRPLVALATLLDLGLTFPGPAPDRLVAGLVRARPARAVRAVRTARTGTAADAAAALVVLLATVTAYDRRRRHHTRRVVAIAALLAERLGIDGPRRERLLWGALLHDVGLLAVTPEILDKAARPAPAQWEVLRQHPTDGARTAGPLLGWLGEEGAAIRHHHERWDGDGYPDGLAGDDIPRAARVVALADAYESMTAARPYRAPLATRAARAEVVRCRGTQFDPAVVDAFLAVPLPRLLLAGGLVALLANLPVMGALARIGRQGVVAVAAPQAAMVAASTAVVLGGVTAAGYGAGTPPPGGPVAAGTATSGTATGTSDAPSTTGPPTATSTVTGTAPSTVTTTATATTTTTAPVTRTATVTRDRTSTATVTATVTATRTATVTGPPSSTPTRTPTTTPTSTRTTGPPTGPTTTPRPTPTTTTPGPTMTTETSTPSAPLPDPDHSAASAAPPVPAQPPAPAEPAVAPGSWFVPTQAPPSPPPSAAPVQDPPTTVLPVIQEPAAGPPAPRVTQRPPLATDLPAAGFSWAIVPGLAYESKLDDGPWTLCPHFWCALFIDLPAGPHHFYVRSVDADGRRSQASRFDWVVAPLGDASPPAGVPAG